MPDQNAIEVTIGAKTSDYVAAMKDAASTTGSAAASMKAELSGIGSSASAAHGPVSGFTDIIKDYRKEISQESRISRMLALDIANMGLASKGAAGEITAFVGAFAIGGGIGVAIEGIKFLVKSFNEASEAEEKAKEDLKQYAEQGVTHIKTLQDAVDALTMSQNDLMFHKEVGPLLEEQFKLRQQSMVASEKLTDAEKSATAVIDAQNAKSKDRALLIELATKNERDEYEQIQKKLVLKAQEIAQATELVNQAGKIEEAKRVEAAQDKANKDARTKAAADLQAEFAALVATREDENVVSTATWAKDVERQQVAFDTAEALKAQQVAERDLLRDAENIVDPVTLVADQEARTAAEMKRATEAADTQRQELVKTQRAAEGAAKGMGDAFGSAFSGMVAGTEDVGTAFKNMMKASLKAIVDVAIASITASAAKASAEAAVSQAGIPLVGPILAAAAMAAMGALVMGLIDTLPSAAVGADIPTFSNPVMQLHGGESVITHPTTDALKEFLDGGGGGDVHVHIHGAIDGPSVHRVVHSDAFVRAIRDARRTGRMP